MVKGKVTDHLTGTMLSGILITVTVDTQTAITNKLGEFMLRFPLHMAGSKITLAATYANATSAAAAHTYITGDTLILSEKNPATVHLYRYPEEHHPPTEIKWKWIRPIPPMQNSPILNAEDIKKTHQNTSSDIATLIPNTYRQRGRSTSMYMPPAIAVPLLPIYPVHIPFFKKLTYRCITRKVK